MRLTSIVSGALLATAATVWPGCTDSPAIARGDSGGAGGDGAAPSAPRAGGAGGDGGGAATAIPEREIDAYYPVARAAGPAPTPPMGWNSWNQFGCDGISAALIMETADAMVTSGMADAGYEYVNIDDCWLEAQRDEDGRLQPTTAGFPDGLAVVADYVHALGLKLGLYGDRGTETCAHRAGSGGHEAVDATTFAEWGIDYLKYDNCAADEATIEADYRAMATALPDHIVYSLCAWAFYEWGTEIGHLWRTTSDIEATWDSVIANMKRTYPLAAYAGPNGWNDPDMLEVGVGRAMSAAQQQAHFAVWAILAAPLIAGNDLRSMSEETRAILTHPDVIAVNQDPLGLAGVPIRMESKRWVWAKPLNESGARAVLLLNESTEATEMGFTLSEIGLGAGWATVRDLIHGIDLEDISRAFTTSVPATSAVLLAVRGNEPPIPRGQVALSDLTPIYAANGLGPVERDQNNGVTAPGDGAPISVGGTVFERGLGMAAPTKLLYRLGGACTRFRATAGLDDMTAGRGSVVFHVFADGEALFTSEVLTAGTAAATIDVDVTGAQRLELRVTNAMDGTSWDRASLGAPELDCEE